MRIQGFKSKPKNSRIQVPLLATDEEPAAGMPAEAVPVEAEAPVLRVAAGVDHATDVTRVDPSRPGDDRELAQQIRVGLQEGQDDWQFGDALEPESA